MDSLYRLPTFEEATASKDVARLPSYSESRGARYHPYSRKNGARHDDVSRLFVSLLILLALGNLFTTYSLAQNTIFDDEHVALDVPPARPGPCPTVAPLVSNRQPIDIAVFMSWSSQVPTPLPNHEEAERQAVERRMQRVSAAILVKSSAPCRY